MTLPRSRIALAAACAVLVAALLASCAQEAPIATSPPSTMQPTTSWVDDEPTTMPARPTSDQGGLDAARQRGVEALTLFLRPDVPSSAWLNELTPYLTVDAYDDFKNGRPTNLPDVEIYGDQAVIADAATAYTAIVIVPTSGGTWHVSMTRTDPNAAWFVGRFQPPYDA